MIHEITWEQVGCSWIQMIVESVRTWKLKFNFRKKENYYLIH
jgi:hypothetical protein